jgi:hypothetical protein
LGRTSGVATGIGVLALGDEPLPLQPADEIATSAAARKILGVLNMVFLACARPNERGVYPIK